jgi:hypothetical protein
MRPGPGPQVQTGASEREVGLRLEAVPCTSALEGFASPLNCAEASPDGQWCVRLRAWLWLGACTYVAAGQEAQPARAAAPRKPCTLTTQPCAPRPSRWAVGGDEPALYLLHSGRE